MRRYGFYICVLPILLSFSLVSTALFAKRSPIPANFAWRGLLEVSRGRSMLPIRGMAANASGRSIGVYLMAGK